MSKYTAIRFNPSQKLAIGFALLILIGALLLMLPISTYEGHRLTFIDALFEATSAVCVTGLIVVDTATTYTMFGEIVLMLLIQIGGLGIMTFGVLIAILLGKNIGLKNRLMLQDILNNFSLAGVVKLAKWIIIFTVTVEGVGALLLALVWSGEMGILKALYYGLFHSVSSFNNAGFDLMGHYSSLTKYVGNIPINLIISSLFIIGGIGFTVFLDIYNKKSIRKLSLHTKLVLITTLIINIVATIFMFLFEHENPHTLGNLPLKDQIIASYFHGVVPRTAGYNTLDLTQLNETSQVLTMGLMFIGGAPGSTAGGIKITTFLLLIMVVWSFITGKEEINIMKRRIPVELTLRALSISMIAVFFVFTAIFLLNITEPTVPFKLITFEVISAFGTVGLTLGLTPELSDLGKIIIVIMMFIGRLGPLTIAFALTKKSKKSLYRYPEGKILIG